MLKHLYEAKCRELADTALYEETINVVKEFEQNRTCPYHDCHDKNAILYAEFSRRNKSWAYYMAFNQTQKILSRGDLGVKGDWDKIPA